MAWILRRRGAVCLALAYLVAVAESSTWGGQAPGAAEMVRRALEEIAMGRTARGITAHFGGEKPPGDTPLEFGVSALWFTFEGDQTPYVFRPTGELYFSDWRVDLISPDGAHVLLLQDHYGPYHIVATNKLTDYLLGRAKPDHIATKSTKPGETALVHSEGHWISPTEMQFTVACCGTSETITYRLP